MAGSRMAEAFTLVGGKEHQLTVFEDFENQRSAKFSSPSLMFLASVRAHHPDMTVAVTAMFNVDLLAYAAAGLATAELDISEDDVLRARFFLPPTSHADDGKLVDATTFARYNYTWKNLKFIMYLVYIYPGFYQFVCFPPDSDETVLSNSKATDALLLAAGLALYGPYQDYIAVYDYDWRRDTELYKEVQKTSWSDVILDQRMKDTISHTIEEFFDNESRYRDLDVPWKRGIIFHGPPGNGKTLSLRALMHSLIAHGKQRPRPITLLYVKSIRWIGSIHPIFAYARYFAPCLLIIEDIDTQLTSDKLSYFFNEADGLENNNGILMIATTNHLDKLDEGLKRPSRFDRRYLFSLPELSERTQYSEFWRQKLKRNGAKVEFPEELSGKIAGITAGFSFATMKEAFIATLLALARRRDVEKDPAAVDKEPIDDLPLWKEIQVQVKLLRKEMEKTSRSQSPHSNNRGRYEPAPSQWIPHRDPREQGNETPERLLQVGPRMINPAGGLDVPRHHGRTVCHRGPALPLPPSPSAIHVTDAMASASYPDVPMLAHGGPPLFSGASRIYEQDFPRLDGRAGGSDGGLGWCEGYKLV